MPNLFDVLTQRIVNATDKNAGVIWTVQIHRMRGAHTGRETIDRDCRLSVFRGMDAVFHGTGDPQKLSEAAIAAWAAKVSPQSADISGAAESALSVPGRTRPCPTPGCLAVSRYEPAMGKQPDVNLPSWPGGWICDEGHEHPGPAQGPTETYIGNEQHIEPIDGPAHPMTTDGLALASAPTRTAA